MKLFEQFIAEAQDEMGLQSRLNSGQLTPEQARVLQRNRTRRDNSSALAIRPKPTTSIAKPNSSALNKPTTTSITQTPKPNTSLVKPQKPSFGQRVSSAIDKKFDRKINKEIPNRIANTIVDAPENLVKGAWKIGKSLLKKQEAPSLGVSVGKDLGGPKVLGEPTR